MSAKTSAIVTSYSALAASSMVFSVTLYGLMRGVLAIPIPLAWFAGILGAQIVVLLLGRTILTPLGGCVLSLLAALAGLGYPTYFIFRRGLVLPLGGLIAGVVVALAAIIMILLVLAGATRSKSALREDAPPADPELVADGDPGRELETGIAIVPEPATEPDMEPMGEVPKKDLFEDSPKITVPRPEGIEKTWTRPEDAGDYEFDFLRPRSSAVVAPEPDGPEEAHPTLDEEALRVVEDAFLVPDPRDEVGAALEDIARLDVDTEGETRQTEIKEAWGNQGEGGLLENAAPPPSRELALAEQVSPDPASAQEPQQEGHFLQQDSEQLSMAPLRRPKFRIVRAASGETLRTFHCDAGYSSLDLSGLQALLTRELHGMEPKIVGINWFDFDEVEVLVEEAAASPQPESAPTSPTRIHSQAVQPGTIRYFVYDRKTYTLAGEYVPEGRFPRLDRLTLHRILPQYDFRTFVIEAIRWVGPGEVRIYVRGDEKGKAVQPAVQRPAGGEPVAARPRRKGPAV